jgi:hypothetical protein
MSRRRRRQSGLREVNLGWYPLALLPILLLIGAPLAGWLPILVLPFGLFFLFFWLFSFGFAIYGKLTRPKEPRQ